MTKINLLEKRKKAIEQRMNTLKEMGASPLHKQELVDIFLHELIFAVI
jgi:hypothetical protein